MTLDTSSNAYEQVYQSSGSDESGKYYEGYVEKKETFLKWTRYWCVLKEKNIHFFKDVNTQIKDNYVGFLALEQPTNVEILKSKGKFEWAIKTKKGKTTLRTHVASLREDWINSMEKSLKNEPPSKESYILDGSGSVSPKHKGSVSPKSPTRTTQRKSSFPGAHPTSSTNNFSRKTSLHGYSLSEDQVGFFQEFSSEIGTIVEDTDEAIRIQEELLNGDKGWYQALYRREEVEKILSNEERGVFIVRDHIDNRTHQKMGYVISLKDENDLMRHHRIRETDGTFVITGYDGRIFDSLHNLLMFFLLSQRKKIALVPFNPKKQKVPRSGYEDMGNPNSPPAQFHPGPSHRNVVRSQTAVPRRLPSTPPRKVGTRAQSFSECRLPTPPPESSDVHEKTEITGYVEMKSPPKMFKDRPLPTPPSQESERSAPRRPLPVPPSPTEPSGYINIPPPMTAAYETPRYENTAESPYVNTCAQAQSEPAPTLPPKRRINSLRETPNYQTPHYPRTDMPGRNPFRKSNTLPNV